MNAPAPRRPVRATAATDVAFGRDERPATDEIEDTALADVIDFRIERAKRLHPSRGRG